MMNPASMYFSSPAASSTAGAGNYLIRSSGLALTELGRDAPSQDELTWCIGPPLRQARRSASPPDDIV